MQFFIIIIIIIYNNDIFIKEGCLKLIKCDSKDCYIV